MKNIKKGMKRTRKYNIRHFKFLILFQRYKKNDFPSCNAIHIEKFKWKITYLTPENSKDKIKRQLFLANFHFSIKILLLIWSRNRWGWLFIQTVVNEIKIIVTKETSMAAGKNRKAMSFRNRKLNWKIKFPSHDLICTNMNNK